MCNFLKNNRQGFSLLEVLVVLCIFSAISAIAIPNFSAWSAKYRLRSAARDVYSAALKAKSEAVKRYQNVALAFGQELDGSANAYVVFLDVDKDCEYDSGTDEIILQQPSLTQSVYFDTDESDGDGLSFLENDEGYPTIVFQKNAIPTKNGGGVADGSAYLVNAKGGTLSVVINQTGSIRIQ